MYFLNPPLTLADYYSRVVYIKERPVMNNIINIAIIIIIEDTMKLP